MHITRTRALILAVFTVWPFFYMLLFMAFVFGSFFWAGMGPHPGPGPNSGMPVMFMALFAMHFATMLEIFALLVIYVIHLFKTAAMPQDRKALWAVVLFLGNMFAMPVYWYLYIWKPLQQDTAAPASPVSA